MASPLMCARRLTQMDEAVVSMILPALWGADEKKLLEILPSKLDGGVITPATSETVITLWKVKVNTIKCEFFYSVQGNTY